MSGNISLNESMFDNCSYFSFPTESTLSNVSKFVGLIVSPFLLLIGIPGNLLTIIVILKQKKGITSTAVYLFMLAVSDTVFLVFGTFFDWLSSVSGFNIREVDAIICKSTEFLYGISAQFSSWLLIVITIERIISIIWPHNYKRVCSSVSSTVAGLVIFIVLAILNSHFLYGFGFSDAFLMIFDSKCGPLEKEPYLTFFFEYWPWIDLTILFAIPFVVLVVGNSVILLRLIRMELANKKIAKNDKTNRKSIGSITLLIVGLNVVFLVSITPLSMFLAWEEAIYDWRDEVMCIDPAEHEYRYGLIELLFQVVLSLSYVNPSVNFILYVLSGTKFRNCVKTLLLCKPVRGDNAFV